jgi:hypothetical protein
MDIGERAFMETGGQALKITLGNTAPTMGANMFDAITVPKTVTVKKPSGATGYDTAWETAFKGGNANITLILEDLP